MGIRLQPGGVHELHDSVYDVHAVAEPTEAREEAPREEVIDEAAMTIVTGPHNPADGQGPRAAAERLEQGALNERRVGRVGQDSPEGTPHIRQHRAKGQHPASDHPVPGQRDLSSPIAREQEVAEDDADQPCRNARMRRIVGQALAQIHMIVLHAEQCEIVVQECGHRAAQTEYTEYSNGYQRLLAPLIQRYKEQRREEVQLGVHSQVPRLRDAL